MRYSIDNRNHFIVCITPLVVFLTACVLADTQVHYNFINNTVFVPRNVVLRDFLGKNVVV